MSKSFYGTFLCLLLSEFIFVAVVKFSKISKTTISAWLMLRLSSGKFTTWELAARLSNVSFFVDIFHLAVSIMLKLLAFEMFSLCQHMLHSKVYTTSAALQGTLTSRNKAPCSIHSVAVSQRQSLRH
jgi:hypothetical protein